MGRRLSQAPQEVGSFVCKWKDESTSWQKMSDLKESQPLQVAEFALDTGIANEPVFNWWGQALDTTSGPISLGLSSQKLWMKLT
ncbi:hypothetical protein ACHAW6_015162 [Cyclotella cf. meneghiniana]